MYVRANPLNATDPSGRKLYFASGAGHDSSSTGYIQMMLTQFAEAGILNPVDIAAHSSQASDLLYTIGSDSKYPAGNEYLLPPIPAYGSNTPAPAQVATRPTDWRVSTAVEKMVADMVSAPLGQYFTSTSRPIDSHRPSLKAWIKAPMKSTLHFFEVGRRANGLG